MINDNPVFFVDADNIPRDVIARPNGDIWINNYGGNATLGTVRHYTASGQLLSRMQTFNSGLPDYFVDRITHDSAGNMGAIASGGVRVFNGEVVNALRIPDEVIDVVSAEELIELQRREKAYRAGLTQLDLEGKTVIVVDDGVATGSTMLAAVSALRQLNADRIVVAAPVIAASSYREIQRKADEVAAVMVPERFDAVGQWYEDFSQTSDEEVRYLLAQAARRQPVEA